MMVMYLDQARAQKQHDGVKRIGKHTEIVGEGYFTTCACGHRIEGYAVISRDADGAIDLCPNCLDIASMEFIKGEKMSDTSAGDDQMPCKLTVVIRAKTPLAIGDALAEILGRTRAGGMKECEETTVFTRSFSIKTEYMHTASPGDDS